MSNMTAGEAVLKVAEFGARKEADLLAQLADAKAQLEAARQAEAALVAEKDAEIARLRELLAAKR